MYRKNQSSQHGPSDVFAPRSSAPNTELRKPYRQPTSDSRFTRVDGTVNKSSVPPVRRSKRLYQKAKMGHDSETDDDSVFAIENTSGSSVTDPPPSSKKARRLLNACDDLQTLANGNRSISPSNSGPTTLLPASHNSYTTNNAPSTVAIGGSGYDDEHSNSMPATYTMPPTSNFAYNLHSLDDETQDTETSGTSGSSVFRPGQAFPSESHCLQVPPTSSNLALQTSTIEGTVNFSHDSVSVALDRNYKPQWSIREYNTAQASRRAYPSPADLGSTGVVNTNSNATSCLQPTTQSKSTASVNVLREDQGTVDEYPIHRSAAKSPLQYVHSSESTRTSQVARSKGHVHFNSSRQPTIHSSTVDERSTISDCSMPAPGREIADDSSRSMSTSYYRSGSTSDPQTTNTLRSEDSHLDSANIRETSNESVSKSLLASPLQPRFKTAFYSGLSEYISSPRNSESVVGCKGTSSVSTTDTSRTVANKTVGIPANVENPSSGTKSLVAIANLNEGGSNSLNGIREHASIPFHRENELAVATTVQPVVSTSSVWEMGSLSRVPIKHCEHYTVYTKRLLQLINDNWKHDIIPSTYRKSRHIVFTGGYLLTSMSNKSFIITVDGLRDIPQVRYNPSSNSYEQLQLLDPVDGATIPLAQYSHLSSKMKDDELVYIVGDKDLVPVDVFLRYILKEADLACTVVQRAIEYFEAIALKVPGLVCSREPDSNNDNHWRHNTSQALSTDITKASARDSENELIAWIFYVLSTSEQYGAESAKYKDISVTFTPAPSPILCPRRSLIAAILLATQECTEGTYSVEYWSRLLNIPTSELRRCELAVLDTLELTNQPRNVGAGLARSLLAASKQSLHYNDNDNAQDKNHKSTARPSVPATGMPVTSSPRTSTPAGNGNATMGTTTKSSKRMSIKWLLS